MTHHDGNNSISNNMEPKKVPEIFLSSLAKDTYDTTSILCERGIQSIWSFNGFGYVIEGFKYLGALWYL